MSVNVGGIYAHAGIKVPVGPQQEPKVCRAMVLCFTADLPAKAKVLTFMQFNGEYGCCICKHPGQVVASGRGHTRAYNHRLRPVPLRKHSECFQLGKQALRAQQVLCMLYIHAYKIATCNIFGA